VKCGFANDAGDRFCGGCGAALIVGATTPAQAGAVDALEAERRPVTVLFADLTGYTRLSQALDAEDVHRLLEKFFAVVDGIVERFDGTVDKHIGDAVMAVFGAPVAHGDDPLRALRAGSEILRHTSASRPARSSRAGSAAIAIVRTRSSVLR
jgi:class 3 adenylate cyclase